MQVYSPSQLPLMHLGYRVWHALYSHAFDTQCTVYIINQLKHPCLIVLRVESESVSRVSFKTFVKRGQTRRL